MSKPGPKANPARRLSDAAILFGVAVEDQATFPKQEWDRLVKAALAYQQEPHPIGRPRNTP